MNALMSRAGVSSFVTRSHRRFPVRLMIAYTDGTQHGTGAVMNISARGWKVLGDSPMVPGATLKVQITAADNTLRPVTIDCAKVRWAQGSLFGLTVETAIPEARKELQQFIMTLARTL
jgi:hypothetical protein